MPHHYCYVFFHIFCFFCAESPYILMTVLFFSPSAGVTLPSFERNLPKVRRSTSLPSCNDRCNRSRSLLTMLHSFLDRKSTRLNSSHVAISYAVFCLKKKTDTQPRQRH